MIEFFVSKQGNNDWTGQAADVREGQAGGPFKTLIRAQQAVRDLITKGLADNVTVYLRGGDYFLEAPITFTAEDTPSEGFTVTYQNYADETPVIYAGLPVTNWQHEGNLVTAPLSRKVNVLYDREGLVPKARFPAKGYARCLPYEEGGSHTQFRADPETLALIDGIDNLQVFIWPGGPSGEWNWFTDIIAVKVIDMETGVVTLTEPTRYDINTGGSRYFFQGTRSLLQTSGQFYQHSETHMLNIIPREDISAGDTPEGIIAPTSPRAFAFVGASPEALVRNIRLIGLEICYSDGVDTIGGYQEDGGECIYPEEDGIIYLQNAEDITVSACHIHHTGIHGIFADGWVQGCDFSNNHMHDIGFTGILLGGEWHSSLAMNGYHHINNNYIHNAGTLVGQGAGIQAIQSGHNQITHNRIHTTSRYAISLKGPHPHYIMYKVIDGVYTREHNKWHFVQTRHNNIAFNDVSNANIDSQDTGVIEAWGVYGEGNRVHNNLVHDSLIYFSFGLGLYFDDMVSFFEVTKNTFYNLQHQKTDGILWSVFYIKGIGNRFINNIIDHCRPEYGVFGYMGFQNDPNTDLEFERNIVTDSGNALFASRRYSAEQISRSDHNLYDADGDEIIVRGIPNTQTYDEWRQLLDRKYDQNSRIAQPRFMDQANNDYRLRYDSPAYGLGFEDVNYRDIGLTADFPFSQTNDPLERLIVYDNTAPDRAYISLNSGDTQQLNVSGRTQTGFIATITAGDATWQTSDADIVEVDAQGNITAKSSGVGQITASIAGVESAFFVLVDDRFDSIEISAPHTTIMNGENMQLHIAGRSRFGQYIPINDARVTYMSDNSAVALITVNGEVISQKRGKATIEVIVVHEGIRRTASIDLEIDNFH